MAIKKAVASMNRDGKATKAVQHSFHKCGLVGGAPGPDGGRQEFKDHLTQLTGQNVYSALRYREGATMPHATTGVLSLAEGTEQMGGPPAQQVGDGGECATRDAAPSFALTEDDEPALFGSWMCLADVEPGTDSGADAGTGDDVYFENHQDWYEDVTGPTDSVSSAADGEFTGGRVSAGAQVVLEGRANDQSGTSTDCGGGVRDQACEGDGAGEERRQIGEGQDGGRRRTGPVDDTECAGTGEGEHREISGRGDGEETDTRGGGHVEETTRRGRGRRRTTSGRRRPTATMTGVTRSDSSAPVTVAGMEDALGRERELRRAELQAHAETVQRLVTDGITKALRQFLPAVTAPVLATVGDTGDGGGGRRVRPRSEDSDDDDPLTPQYMGDESSSESEAPGLMRDCLSHRRPRKRGRRL
eukprot:GHVU01107699.1.p1 GENE.GHVU01107699.1~~GHVU01107699.1.p1  ORF type:complete len:416 (+),score=41.95 GHVU01107699.1:383-1630(+)